MINSGSLAAETMDEFGEQMTDPPPPPVDKGPVRCRMINAE